MHVISMYAYNSFLLQIVQELKDLYKSFAWCCPTSLNQGVVNLLNCGVPGLLMC